MQLRLSIELDQSDLSSREMEVLYLVAKTYSNAQIANELVISQSTVKTHLVHIFDKLDVKSRLEAVMFALRHGWLTLA